MLMTNFQLNRNDEIDSLNINFQNGSQESTLQSVKHLVKLATSIESTLNVMAQKKMTDAIIKGDREADNKTPEYWKSLVTWDDILQNLEQKGGTEE